MAAVLSAIGAMPHQRSLHLVQSLLSSTAVMCSTCAFAYKSLLTLCRHLPAMFAIQNCQPLAIRRVPGNDLVRNAGAVWHGAAASDSALPEPAAAAGSGGQRCSCARFRGHVRPGPLLSARPEPHSSLWHAHGSPRVRMQRGTRMEAPWWRRDAAWALKRGPLVTGGLQKMS